MKKPTALIIFALCLFLLISCDMPDIGNQLPNANNEPPIVMESGKPYTTTEPLQTEDAGIHMSDLTGTWQANDMVASGFCDTYVFGEDGTFYFLANQMLYRKTLNMRGKWTVDGTSIILSITDKITIKDFDVKQEGMFHPDTYEYETEIIHLDEKETVILPVTKPQEDTEVPRYFPTITINGEKFWNFTSDSLLTEEVTGAFEGKNIEGIICLDIDNDGVKEHTEYIAERNVLRISNNAELHIEADLYDFGFDFNGVGMHSSLYYYEYVYGSGNKVFLHLYRTSLIGDNDGKRYTTAFEDYYEVSGNQLKQIDSVQYTWVWDYAAEVGSKENFVINGEPELSLESIEAKYTAVEQTYREISY